jgi:hypothetical protein
MALRKFERIAREPRAKRRFSKDMKVSYKIVQMVAGRMVATCPSDIEAWAEVNGRAVIGCNNTKCHRAELQGQPWIRGLYGPMYDGVNAKGQPVIRYEDQHSYCCVRELAHPGDY